MKYKQIIIDFISEQTDAIHWITLDENNRVQQTVVNGHLNTLKEEAKQAHVTLIVPGQDILLTAVELPKLNRRRVLQALPFALEEQLVDDITELHFAVGEYSVNEAIPTAIISRAKMESWLELFQQAGIAIASVIPSTLALPFSSEHWSGFLKDKISSVRTGKYSGFTCDKENLSIYLTSAFNNSEIKPEGLHLYQQAKSSVTAHLTTLLINEIPQTQKEFLENIANWLKEYPVINLLQGPYQPKHSAARPKKTWLIATGLIASWVFFTLISNIVSYFVLHHEINTLDSAINKIYQQNFPAATQVVAPRERMEQKLKKLFGNVNKNPLLNQLAWISECLKKTTAIHLENFNFQHSEMNLAVSATTFDQLDAFARMLATNEWIVKQQNAAVIGTEVKANLLIRGSHS